LEKEEDGNLKRGPGKDLKKEMGIWGKNKI